MGAVADAFNDAFRAYVVDGMPGSGLHAPEKADARALGALIEALFGPNNLPRTITADDTLTLDDWNRWIICENSTDITITVPAFADASFPVNANVYIWAKGAGSVSVVGDGAVTVSTDELSNPTSGCVGAVMQLSNLDTDLWNLFGRLEAA